MSNASEIRLGGKLEKQKNLERKTIKEWIKYIQEKIRNNSDYDSVYEEYKIFLENKLKENPKNVDVVCQLVAVYNELTYQWDDIEVEKFDYSRLQHHLEEYLQWKYDSFSYADEAYDRWRDEQLEERYSLESILNKPLL